jgi:triacylglycerol lipase
VAARAAFFTLSERGARLFDQTYTDDQRVLYQSVAGVSNIAGVPNPKDASACEGKFYQRASGRAAYPGFGGTPDAMNIALAPIAGTVAHGLGELRPNDGLVTVESAKHGTFLGCIPADHMGEIGQDVFKRPDRITGFSHTRFYRNLAFDLARRGY